MSTYTISPSGIDSTLVLGSPSVTAKIYPTGIASTLAMGRPRFAKSEFLLSAPGQPTTAPFAAASTTQTAVLATASGPATAS